MGCDMWILGRPLLSFIHFRIIFVMSHSIVSITEIYNESTQLCNKQKGILYRGPV